MSKTPQLALSTRGHAFLSVLKEQLSSIDTSDSETARPALNDLGFDDQCLLAIQGAYNKKGILDILSWLQDDEFSLSALFVVINNAGRTCNKPLTGLLSYVLQETLVLHPVTEAGNEESITEICVPWFDDETIEEAHFYSLEDDDFAFTEKQAKHVRDILIGRLKEAFITKLKHSSCPRGEKRTILIDCQGPLTIDDEYDTFLKEQIHLALQEVVSCLNDFQIKKVAEVYYLSEQNVSEAQEGIQKYNPVIFLEDGALVENESLSDVRLTLFKLKADLARPEKGCQFLPTSLDERTLKAVIADLAFNEKKPAIYFANQYLKALRDTETMLEEVDYPMEGFYNRSPTQSVKQLAHHKSKLWGAQAFYKKKKAVLVSVSIVPVVLGAVLGLSLAASGVISASSIPFAFASMGAMGFGGLTGILAGVGLALVLLMIAGPVLSRQGSKHNMPAKRFLTDDLNNPSFKEEGVVKTHRSNENERDTPPIG